MSLKLNQTVLILESLKKKKLRILEVTKSKDYRPKMTKNDQNETQNYELQFRFLIINVSLLRT